MRPYPNVHVRLRLSQRAPALKERVDEVEIWLDGTRFHVRDESGRQLHEILGEITAPRGLGMPARTMEDIMDRYDASSRKRTRTTELYGDLATDRGWFFLLTPEPWEVSATMLAPIAEQILSCDRHAGLRSMGEVTRLGRTGVEYHGVVDVVEDDNVRRNDVTRVIAAPFLLFEQVHDANNAEHFYMREILVLEEGTVTDADVLPPGD